MLARRIGFVAPCLWVCLVAAMFSSAPAHAVDRGVSFERIHAVRASLPVDPPRELPVNGLARRAPMSSLDVLVIGCDFADSLMYGRDLDDFPGWPEQRRGSQVIPEGDGFGTPVFEAHDASYFDLQMQRVDDYFRSVSFGRFDLRWDVHPEIVNLPEAMGYYGEDDSSSVRAVRMAQQVIRAIDDDVDFSGYDTVLIIHAGAGQETDINGDSRAQIFSNYLDVRDFERAVEAEYLAEPFIETGERQVEHVLILPESQAQDPPTGNGLAGFFDVRGVFAFELGLRMGMISLADFTPGNFPDSQGIGNFGLMGYGLFTGLGTVPSAPSAVNRMFMGWIDPVEVTADADLRIGAMGPDGEAVSDTLLVRVPITDREYWLVEYRLQDPNGDLFYTFPGKAVADGGNGNSLPDYFDADSTTGDGVPTSPYDAAVDTWEDELGAEWDWFMSENGLRTPDGCQRAGGSGLYIWHVDERVIQDALLAGTNTINGDATRKGVDLEEADGLQDLDSLRGGPYLLGSDDDSWRGEGNTVFGPATRPGTTSNDGFETGIRFSEISKVVRDTFPPQEFPPGSGNFFCTGFDYAPAMTFRVEFGVDEASPVESGRIRMTDMGPLFDLRAGDFFGPGGTGAPDGADELIAVADAGRVLIWQDGTTPFNGTDAIFHQAADGEIAGPAALLTEGEDPPLLIVTSAGEPPLEVLTPTGPLSVDDMTDDGVGEPITGFANETTGDFPLGGGYWLRSRDGQFTVERFSRDVGAPRIITLYTIDDRLDAAILHPSNGWPVTVAVDSTGTATLNVYRTSLGIERSLSFDEGIVTDSLTPLSFGSAGLGMSIGWVDGGGRVHVTALEADQAARDRSSLETGLPASTLIAAPVRDGGGGSVIAISLGDGLHVYDTNLRSLPGFPYRVPRGGVDGVVGQRAAAPILVDLTGDGQVEVIWHEPAGTVHAVDLQGRALDGWPVAGPAEPISSPLVADLDGDGDLDLAVAGRFENVIAVDSADRDFERRVSAEIRIFDLQVPASAYAPYAQGGGDARNRAAGVIGDQGRAVGSDPGLVVYPNPTVDGRARVRVRVREAGRFTLTVYTLEGQEVLSVGPVAVPAGAFFEEEIALGDVASGMYLCRVSGDGIDERGVLAVER